ncbi:MAG: hypothetical protein Q8T08_22940, partial [Ignavibacteria bacterium]|nr:hypothetical protein [Ignavibacteria bacterium]
SGTTPAANGAPASADTSDSPNLLQRFADGASRNYVGSRANIVFSQWQLVGLFFAGMTWPSLYVSTIGPIGSVASLKLDMSFSVHFEVSYYITTVLELGAFAVVATLVLSERARTFKDLERDLRRQLDVQLARMEAGKKPALVKSKRETICWLALTMLNAMYIPATRNAVLAAFCHPTLFCLYDCYNEPRHNSLVAFGIVIFALVTLCTPIALFVIALRKRREFVAFVGDVSTHPKLQERLWESYIQCDPSPYKSIYTGLTLHSAPFQSFNMAIKALMCFFALGIAPDTSAQVVTIMLLQCVATWAVGLSAPFVLDNCNWMLLQSQFFVLLTLVLQAFHRIDPDERDASVGRALVAVAIISIVAQVASFAFLRKGPKETKPPAAPSQAPTPASAAAAETDAVAVTAAVESNPLSERD